MKKRMIALLLALLLAPTALADQKALKAKMLKELDVLKALFETDYAPAEWKKDFFGWTLQTAIDDAKDRVKSCDSISVKGYHQILRDLFNSMKDYHVGIRFHSTEKSVLPFQIKGAGGRYFFVYIDRDFLPEKSFPFKEGDELVKFGDMSTGEAVREVQKMLGNNMTKTDEALAEILLTRRVGKAAREVHQGPIMLTIKRKETGKLVRHQLIWDYAPEKINYDVDFVKPEEGSRIRGEHRANLFDKKMVTPYWTDFNGVDLGENPHFLGSKVGFIPALGEKVWQSSAENPFDAYIYQTGDGKKVGYIRIPNYDADGLASIKVAYFQELIRRFNDETDALVIDQMNNPGGSVFYLYALASMLADQALLTPRHRMTITQADVFDAYETLESLEKVKNDAEAIKELGDSLRGYPVSYQMVRYFIEYCRFIIAEWNAGRTLTHPYYLVGVDAINPAPIHYAKPILLLVNSLDFSGGDFFPAILQDNKRVTLLGTRTAGAGGYVIERKYPNQFGIDYFTVTGSIAERASDHLPIENLGVAPDIEYEVTAEDLQNNYSGYVAMINSAVAGLIK